MKDFTTFSNRQVCDLVFVEYNTRNPFLNMTYANATATEMTGEVTYAYGGKDHPKKIAFHGERGGTLTIETQLQTMKLYSLISGAEIESTAEFIQREVCTCETEGKLTLSKSPIIGTIYTYKEDDDCGTALVGTYAATSGTEGAGFDITFTVKEGSTDKLEVGNSYAVYYMTKLTKGIKKINIKSTTFPKAFSVYGDTFDKTESDEIIGQKMVAYKCVPQSNFTLNFASSGDANSLTITCDLLSDKDNNILDLITVDEDE